MRIFTLFELNHRNRLKNIFCYFFKDMVFWQQIEKLILCNSISFDFRFIYEKNDFLFTNFLSIILLEVYFFDFDCFIRELSFKFSSFKNIFLRPFSNYNNFEYLSFANFFFPLKLEKGIISSLKRFNLFSFRSPSFYFNNLNFESYVRTFSACRYKNRLLLGFTSSRNYSSFIKSKLSSFLRTVLSFDFDSSPLFSPNVPNFFIGFDILLFPFSKKANDNKLKCNIFFKKKLISRIDYFKWKFMKTFMLRIRYELTTNLFLKKNLSGILKGFSFDSKFWSYFFQLEAVRSFRYYRVLLMDDIFLVLPTKVFSSSEFNSILQYKDYYFSVYLNKINLSFSSVARYNKLNIVRSVLPFDIFASDVLFDLYNYFDLTHNVIFNPLFKKTTTFNFKLSGLISSNSLNRRNSFATSIKFLAPLNYLHFKFRIFGFVHFLKNRPIGNSNYLGLTDFEIILSFSIIYIGVVLWYYFTNNFKKLLAFMKILRESCILTLSRKHNKSKSWVKAIFSINLSTINKLYFNSNYFPFFHNLGFVDANFYFEKNLILVDEQFFLDY